LSNRLKILTGLGVSALAIAIFLYAGLARSVFFELFAFVKGVEVLGPTVVREPPTESPYQRWLATAGEEMPVFEGLVIEDVTSIPLRPWEQMGEGVTGLYLRFADYQMSDGRILEIPVGGHTTSERRLYEQGIYFLSGSGYTLLQQEGKPQQRLEWRTGDLVSIPLNVHHQHFSTGDIPARMLIVTSFPLLLNVMASEAFIADNSFAFMDRYDGTPDYFARVESDDPLVTTNFVEDIRHTETLPLDYRGKGSESVAWLMAANSMLRLHISEMPAKMYKKAHRHSSDAFILILSGEGFSVTWAEGAYDKRKRIDWKAGTLFVPPTYWYHQHLNTGSTPARYLAINAHTLVSNIGLRFSDQLEVDIEEVKVEWEKALENTAREH
jgi:gentisate 1,2-dioxygenase